MVGDTLNIDSDQYENTLISSSPSNIYCFYDSFSIEIYSTNYSKEISSSEVFEKPLVFQVLTESIFFFFRDKV